MMSMDIEREKKFHLLFEELVSAMTDLNNVNVPLIEDLVIRISSMFRLSKGVTHIYSTIADEQNNISETLCCYDTGKEGEEIIHLRVVTSIMSIATITVYMSPDEEPLTDDEYAKVELVMRSVLSFVSRNRIRDLVEKLALYDSSGFRNLRSFYNYLDKMNLRNKLGGMAAIRYNLRHYTLVNQEIGKLGGDTAMFNHFKMLERIIGDQGSVFRLGGDNFVALCDQKQLDEVLDYLAEAEVVYNDKEGSCINIVSSVGYYCIPDDFKLSNPGDIMDKIITAVQLAQSGKRNRIVCYDESLQRDKEKSMRVQQLFPEALRNEEFQVYYQPKVNIITNKLCGAEALCRWFRNGEMISPNEFIPMLEETNDICKLDFYMLDHVCRDIRKWLDSGVDPVRVSVNLSRKHMMDTNLLQNIIDIINKYDIPHHYIEFELTETTTDVEFRDLKRVVGGLQQEGIKTSVDDFGVGYSSLNLIRDVPWNVLKIDRSFLPEESDGADSSRRIMFKHVIAMAKKLGLECIAEGVETKGQLDALLESHCDLAQGFLFDRPLPIEKFEERLNNTQYTLNV